MADAFFADILAYFLGHIIIFVAVDAFSGTVAIIAECGHAAFAIDDSGFTGIGAGVAIFEVVAWGRGDDAARTSAYASLIRRTFCFKQTIARAAFGLASAAAANLVVFTGFALEKASDTADGSAVAAIWCKVTGAAHRRAFVVITRTFLRCFCAISVAR